MEPINKAARIEKRAEPGEGDLAKINAQTCLLYTSGAVRRPSRGAGCMALIFGSRICDQRSFCMSHGVVRVRSVGSGLGQQMWIISWITVEIGGCSLIA